MKVRTDEQNGIMKHNTKREREGEREKCQENEKERDREWVIKRYSDFRKRQLKGMDIVIVITTLMRGRKNGGREKEQSLPHPISVTLFLFLVMTIFILIAISVTKFSNALINFWRRHFVSLFLSFFLPFSFFLFLCLIFSYRFSKRNSLPSLTFCCTIIYALIEPDYSLLLCNHDSWLLMKRGLSGLLFSLSHSFARRGQFTCYDARTWP